MLTSDRFADLQRVSATQNPIFSLRADLCMAPAFTHVSYTLNKFLKYLVAVPGCHHCGTEPVGKRPGDKLVPYYYCLVSRYR